MHHVDTGPDEKIGEQRRKEVKRITDSLGLCPLSTPRSGESSSMQPRLPDPIPSRHERPGDGLRPCWSLPGPGLALVPTGQPVTLST